MRTYKIAVQITNEKTITFEVESWAIDQGMILFTDINTKKLKGFPTEKCEITGDPE
jgi:hypothetical protein